MKHLKILLLLIVLSPLAAMADKPRGGEGPKKDSDRTEWFRKLKEAKHSFLTRELDLTESQREEFFKLYDAKEAERQAAEQKVRNLEKEVKKKGAAATDNDYDKVITAQYKFNHEIAKIESKYEQAFRKVLTKRQLYKLRSAEFSFDHKLMRQEHKDKK